METNKRKALGKGLEQLFSNESLYVEPTVYVEPAKKIEEIVENTPKESPNNNIVNNNMVLFLILFIIFPPRPCIYHSKHFEKVLTLT